MIWIFHIGNLRSLQKKHRLLCQQETVSMLYLLSPICVYVSLFRCLILFKFIMTKDNSTADRQKRRRKREREIQIPFLCIHAVVSKSNPACSSVLLEVCACLLID